MAVQCGVVWSIKSLRECIMDQEGCEGAWGCTRGVQIGEGMCVYVVSREECARMHGGAQDV